MVQCASVRKKGTTEQCSAKALINSDFCGRHSKARNPVRWVGAANESSIIKLQSILRGFLVRRRLRYSGPGVLNRKACINDEELVTLDDKNSVHPFDYFGWIQNDKLWWMSIVSVMQLFRGELHPTNPYSREPFPLEARLRIRKLYVYRIRNKLPLGHVQPQDVERMAFRFNTISQIMEENGYDEFHPNSWAAMNRWQMSRYLELLIRILTTWALEKPIRPWRTGLLSYVRRSYTSVLESPQFSQWYASCATMTCLIQDRGIHEIAFMIASARHQVIGG